MAKTAGFCFGVNRAVELTYGLLAEGHKVATLGPLIHNPQAVEDMRRKGAQVVDTVQDVPAGCEVVIRSHGVPRSVYDELEARGIAYHDATCPFVKKIHRIVEQKSTEGYHVIVVGDPKHPEVEGIVGWCQGPVTVLETPEQAENFVKTEGEKLCIVSQTTYNYNKFQYIVEIFEKKGYNDSVVNTICNATEERQRSAKAIAAEADVMIVIGGKHSSNSRKLYEICQRECVHTYFIQTLDDLHLDLPKAVRLVGITAGASTPNKLIEEVQNYVRINF